MTIYVLNGPLISCNNRHPANASHGSQRPNQGKKCCIFVIYSLGEARDSSQPEFHLAPTSYRQKIEHGGIGGIFSHF